MPRMVNCVKLGRELPGGHRQADEVSRLLMQSQHWELIEIVKDYGSIERVVVAQRRQKGNGTAWITSKSKVESSFTGTCA